MQDKIMKFIEATPELKMVYAFERELKQHVIYFDGDHILFIKRFAKFFTPEEQYEIFTEQSVSKVKEISAVRM